MLTTLSPIGIGYEETTAIEAIMPLHIHQIAFSVFLMVLLVACGDDQKSKESSSSLSPSAPKEVVSNREPWLGPEPLSEPRLIEDVLPERVREILANGSNFEIFSLWPNRYRDFDPLQDPSPHLYGYKIRGRSHISDAEGRALVAKLYEAIGVSDGRRSRCFFPRHALSVMEGDDHLELVTCFPSFFTRMYLNGEMIGRVTHLKLALELYDQIAKKHGVEIHE